MDGVRNWLRNGLTILCSVTNDMAELTATLPSANVASFSIQNGKITTSSDMQ